MHRDTGRIAQGGDAKRFNRIDFRVCRRSRARSIQHTATRWRKRRTSTASVRTEVAGIADSTLLVRQVKPGPNPAIGRKREPDEQAR